MLSGSHPQSLQAGSVGQFSQPQVSQFANKDSEDVIETHFQEEDWRLVAAR